MKWHQVRCQVYLEVGQFLDFVLEPPGQQYLSAEIVPGVAEFLQQGKKGAHGLLIELHADNFLNMAFLL